MKWHDNYYRKVGSSCVGHMNFSCGCYRLSHLLKWLLYWLFSFLPGDELLTDTYKITIKDDVFFEVEGKVRNCLYYHICLIRHRGYYYFITQFGAASVREEQRLLNSMLPGKSFVNVRALRKTYFVRLTMWWWLGFEANLPASWSATT